MKLLQRLHLLPADDHRFGFWRSLLASLVTGLVLSTLVIQISEEDSFSLRLGLGLGFSMLGWLVPLFWNRRAVALGAPGFWAVWGRCVRRWTWAIAVVVTVMFLARAIEGFRAARAWQETEARLKQRGEPLTFDDLVGPRAPDDQNFARHPLMAGILNHEETTNAKGRPTHRWTGQRKLAELKDALRFPDPPTDGPKAGKRLRRTGPDLEALAGVLKSGTNRAKRTLYEGGRTEPRETNDLFHLPIPPAAMPAPQAVLYAFEGRRAILDQVTEAARRPHAHYDIRYADGPNAILPHLALHKSMAVQLRTRAAARVAAGDTAGAAEDIDTMFRLAELTGEDPTLIGYLVRVAIQNIASGAFWDGTSQHAWSEAQLVAFQQRFAALKQRDALVQAFRGERLFGKTTFELMRQGRLDPEMLGAMDSGRDGFIGAVMPKAWLLQNQAYHSRVMDQIVDALQHSDPERGIGAKGSAWEKERIDGWLVDTTRQRYHPYRIFTHMLLPALAQVHAKADRSLTTARLAMAVAALERHRLANGGYPKTLADLVPRFLPAVPIDPMDGQPLRYRLNADGSFTLYGVGPNHADDNGVFESKQGHDLDWVWPPNHPTEERRLF
jgi:hypothetical protein